MPVGVATKPSTSSGMSRNFQATRSRCRWSTPSRLVRSSPWWAASVIPKRMPFAVPLPSSMLRILPDEPPALSVRRVMPPSRRLASTSSSTRLNRKPIPHTKRLLLATGLRAPSRRMSTFRRWREPDRARLALGWLTDSYLLGTVSGSCLTIGTCIAFARNCAAAKLVPAPL